MLFVAIRKRDYGSNGEKAKTTTNISLRPPDLREALKVGDEPHVLKLEEISNRADLIVLRSCQEGI